MPIPTLNKEKHMNRKQLRLSGIVAGAAAVVLALAGCSSAAPQTDGGATDGGGTGAADFVPSFAFIAADLSDFGQMQLEGAESVAEGLGGSVTMLDGANDDNSLTTICNDAIASGRYNGIILNPVSAPGAIPCVEAAYEAGIAVATVESFAGPSSTTVEPQLDGVIVSVGTSNQNYGSMVAENLVAACEGFDPCNYIHIFGIKGYQLSEDIHTAVQDRVGDDARFVEVAQGEDYFTPDDGRQIVADLIAANPETNVVLNSSDSTAVQVAALLKEIDRTDIVVIGDGGSRQGLAGIADGSIASTVILRPFTYGKTAAEALVAHNTGGHVPTPEEVAELAAPFIVNAENVDGIEGEWG